MTDNLESSSSEVLDTNSSLVNNTILFSKLTDTNISTDVETLFNIFTKIISFNSIYPDFYVTSFEQNRSVWLIDDAPEQIKNVKQFLPNCKLPEKLKKNYFMKAQRANNDELIANVLCNFLSYRMNQGSGLLLYKGHPITEVGLKWVTVTGHSTPFLDGDNKRLVGIKHNMCVIDLTYTADLDVVQHVYYDLCTPQIDVFSYNLEGYPIYKTEALTIGAAYSAENPNVVIVDIGPTTKFDAQCYKTFVKSFETYCDNNDTNLGNIDEPEIYLEYVCKMFIDEAIKEETMKNMAQNKDLTPIAVGSSGAVGSSKADLTADELAKLIAEFEGDRRQKKPMRKNCSQKNKKYVC